MCLFFLCFISTPARSEDNENQSCRSCHLPHPARVTHEIHADVSCESCHLKKGTLYRDPVSGRIELATPEPETGEDIHDDLQDVSDEKSCRECHFKGNTLGAPARVLPPKSFLCLPCHAATFSGAGHPLIIVALAFFGTGMLNLLFIWKRSARFSKTGRRDKTPFLIRAFVFVRSLASALFINKRLFRQSRGRWLIHGFIIYPLLMRCLWGLTALLGSLYAPQWDMVWPMLNRDYPVTALFFDSTGILMLSGFLLVLFRHAVRQKSLLSDKLNGLPRTDWPGFILLGALILSGFLQEALRLAMSGSVARPYAFAGYTLSRMLNGWADPASVYVYFWYAHFIITLGLVAYLPFSRLKHLIMGPVSIALQSVREYEKKAKSGPPPGNKGD